MKKLKMIVTSVIVLAIVGSAFAFNAKKIGKFCVTADLTTTTCNSTIQGFKRVTPGDNTRYYVVDWDGAVCGTGAGQSHTCTTSARFVLD